MAWHIVREVLNDTNIAMHRVKLFFHDDRSDQMMSSTRMFSSRVRINDTKSTTYVIQSTIQENYYSIIGINN